VSSAYYAVFHALSKLCADALVGWGKAWDVYVPIYRSLEHTSFKRVQKLDPKKAMLSADAHRLLEIAIELQGQRHLADYDPQPFNMGRKEVLDTIDQAKEAIRIVSALPRDDQLKLPVHLIAKFR